MDFELSVMQFIDPILIDLRRFHADFGRSIDCRFYAVYISCRFIQFLCRYYAEIMFIDPFCKIIDAISADLCRFYVVYPPK